LIEAKGLRKEFGDFVAVKHVDMNVAEGEVFTLLGPNGAGKTTTVRMLGSILKPTRGHATVAGFDTISQAIEVRQRIGVLTEFPGLYTRMSAMEYLNYFGELQGLTKSLCHERAEKLLKMFGLWGDKERITGEYSKGMKQKLTLVRAMLHDPQVLFLDEPTSNMDPHSAKLVRDAITKLCQEKRTIVVCTHNLMEAETLADRIAIIHQGKIVARGTVSELKNQLLGMPLMELRLACNWNGDISCLDGLVEIVANGDNWIHYTTSDPEKTNPRVLHHLAQNQISVVTLSEIQRSLEEVYLKIVDEVQSTHLSY